MTMLVIRLVVSLLVIAGILWLAMKVAKKRQGSMAAGAMEVIARQPLTRTTSVALVRVGDRAFVLGSGDTQVTLIGETDLESVREHLPEAVSAATSGPAGASTSPVAGSVFDGNVWKTALNGLRAATVRQR